MDEEDEETDQSQPYSSIHCDTSAVHHNINPDCPVCLKPVFWSRHILSLDRVWHVQCFICSYCYKSLKPGEQSFHGGKIFCTEPCFNELFLGHYTNFESRKIDVDNKTRTIKDNKNVTVKQNKEIKTTEETVQQQNDPKLNSELNEQQATEKTDQQKMKSDNKCDWTGKPHPTDSPCLHCLNCEHPIINHQRFLTDNYPHSKFPGYKENVNIYQVNQKKNLKTQINLNRSVQTSDFIGQRCVRCLKKVYAAELCYSINFPWHLDCLRCSICDRKLQPAAHAVHDGLPICNFPCYNRIYNEYLYRKGFQESKP